MLVLEQWLAGRDFAERDPIAAQMVNFVYLLGDSATRRAWLVDPVWDIGGLVARVEARGFELAGALLTHWHPDHAGGDLFGIQAEGAALLHERTGCALRAHRLEAPWLARWSGIAEADLTLFDSDEVLALGEVRARCLHAPGHTPGSTCFWIADRGGEPGAPGALLTGDVLFVGACGRVDLPGSDPEEMFRTLTRRLADLPEETVIYPGHDYGPRPTSTLAHERRTNPYLQGQSFEEWLGG